MSPREWGRVTGGAKMKKSCSVRMGPLARGARRSARSCAAMLSLFALCACISPAHAKVGITLLPDHSIINRGDTLRIAVGVSQADTTVTRVFGLGFELQVDPRQFEVLALNPSLLSTQAGMLSFNHVEQFNGKIAFSMTHTFGQGVLPSFQACEIVLRVYAGAESFVAPLALKHVAAVDRDGTSILGYSDSTFVIIQGDAASVSGAGRSDVLRLSPVWPNPLTSDHGLALLRMPVESAVSARLVDVTGRSTQATIEDQRLAAGEHLLRIDTSLLAAGHYFLRVEVGSQSLIRPLTKY